MCFAGCGSDNERNFVGAAAIGFVDSIVGSVVVLAESRVFLAGNFAFLAGFVGLTKRRPL